MHYAVFDLMEQGTAEQVQQLLPQVPAWRREKALRYKYTCGQYACLKSWLMLHEALNTQCKNFGTSEWQYGAWGKPYIDGGPEFSLSHCREGIAVAWDTHPIGIDIEAIRNPDKALIERTMNNRECARIASDEHPSRAFIRLWTQKEALLKYTGTGIQDDIRNVLTAPPDVHFLTVETERYIYTVCYHNGSLHSIGS